MIPLFVQQHYIDSMCNSSSLNDLERLAKASDYMSQGDIVLNETKSEQQWSLMPSIGILTCIAPATLVSKFCRRIDFPLFLARFSTSRKHARLIREISECLGFKVGSISKDAIQHEFTPLLFDLIIHRLEQGTKSSVNKAVEIL